ncbi:uracil-DNA glycosylase family protein [Crocinitomix catalasitica]|uniref:uracil-DNA glycosylase family protein n=1 Tax=Crocinitomix catalasitica TaxID=184607 RepID=UPI0004827F67|nr:uracil-DNA glycosylase family protein [Crocinitomix catalasitica]
MESTLKEIRKCQICSDKLPHPPRPVLSISSHSIIIIIGQAPGAVVHRTGKPWDDKSGERLRKWLNVDNDSFYNTSNFGILPMGFCYPGKGKSGDLPPRKECTSAWHELIISQLNNTALVLLIGSYAQDYYLKHLPKQNLTSRVKAYKNYLPDYFVLPHPSPRNGIWLKKNDWFEKEVIPELQFLVKNTLT